MNAKARKLIGTELHGEQFGVRFEKLHDGIVSVRVLSEDDGFWHEKDVVFDPSWLDDFIEVLERARAVHQAYVPRSTSAPAKK